MDELVAHLRRQMVQAMKDRDAPAVAALRSAMAALANAEAVPVADGPYDPSEGAYGGEALRRELSSADARAVLLALVGELDEAEQRYRSLGRDDESHDLARQVAVLREQLSGLAS